MIYTFSLQVLDFQYVIELNNKISFIFHCNFRYSDGTVKLRNPNIELMDQDILYHLALGSESHDLYEMFGDVKVSFLTFFIPNLIPCSDRHFYCVNRNKRHY